MTMTDQRPQVGSAAPDCLLPDLQGANEQLSQLWAERPVLLVFLPDVSSPYYADNAAQLRESEHLFDSAGVTLAAVVEDQASTVARFHDDWRLEYAVYADPEGNACAAFGLRPDEPGSLIIDTSGVVRYAHYGARPDDYPSTYELLKAASEVTGKQLELPKPPPKPQLETPPMVVERGAIVSGAYQCAKCGHAAYEMNRVSAAGGWISRIFNFQLRGFTAVTCTRCTYTELYKTDSGAMANVLDILFGR